MLLLVITFRYIQDLSVVNSSSIPISFFDFQGAGDIVVYGIAVLSFFSCGILVI